MKKQHPKIYILIIICIAFLLGMQYQPSIEERVQEAPIAQTPADSFETEPVLVERKVSTRENKEVILTSHPLLVRQGEALISATDLKNCIPNLKIRTNSDHSVVEVQKLKRLYFPINREIYFEMDKVYDLKGAAAIVDEEIYLPLRPIFESFGYQVYYNAYQQEILYSNPYRKNKNLISEDKIKASVPLSVEKIGNAPVIFNYYHGIFNGYSRNSKHGGLDFFTTDFNGDTEMVDHIPLNDTLTSYLSDDQLNYFFSDGIELYAYNLERETIDNLNLPLQLKGTHFLGYTKDKFYFYYEGEIYYYHYKKKRVGKLPIDHLPKDMIIAKGKGIFAYGDKLISLDLKTYKAQLIDIDRGPNAFTVLMKQGNYLLYQKNHERVYVIYDLVKDETIFTIPWGAENTPYLSFSEGSFLLVQFDKQLDVYDLIKGQMQSYDITNLISDYPHGAIQWYTDGLYLDGHWISGLELEEPISRKLIRVKP